MRHCEIGFGGCLADELVIGHGSWPAELPRVELAFSADVWASVLRALKGADGLLLTWAWEGASGSAGRTESTSNS